MNMTHEEKKTVFLVDDNAVNLAMAEEALSPHYRVISLASAEKMFAAFSRFTPQLILLDIEMPEMNGLEAMKLLKADEHHSKIPVIFLTGRADPESETLGIELGAVDFITKPFTECVLLTRVKNHINVGELIKERTEKLEKIQQGLVYVMADLVENRDGCTGGHIERTSQYMEILIDGMKARGVYIDEIKNWDVKNVVSSSRLHDIGKIAIPDSILNKPGKLTNEEFDIMKEHSIRGAQIIDNTIQKTGDEDFLVNARTIAEYHHEKWNGKGYSQGLSGTEIPLLGRIMAIVDVYDALVSERPYKRAFSHEQAVEIITEDSGTHFDPEIVNVFLKVSDKIVETKERYGKEA